MPNLLKRMGNVQAEQKQGCPGWLEGSAVLIALATYPFWRAGAGQRGEPPISRPLQDCATDLYC